MANFFSPENEAANYGLAMGLLSGQGWSPTPQSGGQGWARGLAGYAQGREIDRQRNAQLAEQKQWQQLAKEMGLEGVPANAMPGLVSKMLEQQYGRKEPKVVGNYLVGNDGQVLFHDQGGGKQHQGGGKQHTMLSDAEAKRRGLPTDRKWQISPEGKVDAVFSPQRGGMTVTTPDGTVIDLGGGQHGDLTKPTVNRLQEDVVNFQAGMDRLRQIRASARPEFLTAQGRVAGIWAKGKDYFDAATPEEKKYLSDFTSFKSNTLDNLNRYIKEITGAAMTNAEASRIKAGMPTTEDSPTEFASKWDATMTQLSRANARASYTLKSGLPLDNVSLDDMDKIINQRAREIMGELKRRNPGISDQDAIKAAQAAVNREFGQ